MRYIRKKLFLDAFYLCLGCHPQSSHVTATHFHLAPSSPCAFYSLSLQEQEHLRTALTEVSDIKEAGGKKGSKMTLFILGN